MGLKDVKTKVLKMLSGPKGDINKVKKTMYETSVKREPKNRTE